MSRLPIFYDDAPCYFDGTCVRSNIPDDHYQTYLLHNSAKSSFYQRLLTALTAPDENTTSNNGLILLAGIAPLALVLCSAGFRLSRSFVSKLSTASLIAPALTLTLLLAGCDIVLATDDEPELNLFGHGIIRLALILAYLHYRLHPTAPPDAAIQPVTQQPKPPLDIRYIITGLRPGESAPSPRKDSYSSTTSTLATEFDEQSEGDGARSPCAGKRKRVVAATKTGLGGEVPRVGEDLDGWISAMDEYLGLRGW